MDLNTKLLNNTNTTNAAAGAGGGRVGGSGYFIDPPVSGASIYFDSAGTGKPEDNAVTLSDTDGAFPIIPSAEFSLYATGGSEVRYAEFPSIGYYSAPSGAIIVSPFSTVLDIAIKVDPSLTNQTAMDKALPTVPLPLIYPSLDVTSVLNENFYEKALFESDGRSIFFFVLGQLLENSFDLQSYYADQHSNGKYEWNETKTAFFTEIATNIANDEELVWPAFSTIYPNVPDDLANNMLIWLRGNPAANIISTIALNIFNNETGIDNYTLMLHAIAASAVIKGMRATIDYIVEEDSDGSDQFLAADLAMTELLPLTYSRVKSIEDARTGKTGGAFNNSLAGRLEFGP